jgi:hypothetical protein
VAGISIAIPLIALSMGGCSGMAPRLCQGMILHRGGNLVKPAVVTSHTRLEVGDEMVVCVESRCKSNLTGLEMKPRESYRFTVPERQTWTDWFTSTSPAGYPPRSSLQERARCSKPMPDQNWFALCGAIGCPTSHPFVIGSGTTVKIEPQSAGAQCPSGKLVLFANDAKHFYWNNFGRVWVLITRTR